MALSVDIRRALMAVFVICFDPMTIWAPALYQANTGNTYILG